MPNYLYNNETYGIRGAIFEVYKNLGTGFLEDVYQNALEQEFTLREIPFQPQPPLKIFYKGCDCGLYRPDFICYNKIIVELKAVDRLLDQHIAQLLNYLRATGCRLGFLINFNAFPQVEIRRFIA